METRKTTFGTSTNLSTLMTDLGSVVRFNSNKFNTRFDRFILNKTLQLVETPVANPVVHNPSSTLFPYTFEVFHNNLVSVKIGNNVFTNVVVNPSHVTSFSSREFSKQSLTGTSAFRLKLGTQMFELPFGLFDFSRIIKSAVGSDSKIVYSEVNAQNFVRANVLLSGSNLFRESEQEEASSFFIDPEKTFFNIPTEIFFVTIRDVQVELLPSFEQSQNQSFSFKISTPREIVSHRSPLDDGFCLGFFDHATSLFYATDSNLGREFELLPESMIDSVMQLEVFSDFMFPSVINTELESFSVNLNSSEYLLSWIDSDFSSYVHSHNNVNSGEVFK